MAKKKKPDPNTKCCELTSEHPKSEAEMMKIFSLDPARWIPQHFKGTMWDTQQKGGALLTLHAEKIVCKRIMAEELEDAILSFVKRWVKPLPKKCLPKGAYKKGKYLAVFGLWDLHLGAYAWNKEVGADWDVDIACHRAMNAIDDIIQELSLYPIDHIIVPLGGDFLHYDSNRMQTVSGDHHLDCDTRFARVYLAGLRLVSYMLERATELCPRIEFLYIPGNHDASTAFTLCAAMQERYRNDSRIGVDLNANPRKYRLYGGTLLGFDHGKTPMKQLKLIFAEEAKAYWSASHYREMQIGHTHQRRTDHFQGVLPMNGLTIRTNPALCNADFWHHSNGLIGEAMRSMEAYRYDKIGYRGSHVAWMRDTPHPEAVRLLKELT